MRVKPWSGHSRKTLAAALHLHLHLLLLLRSGFHQNLCSSCYRTCYRPCFMCTRPVWGCEVPACAGIVFLSRLFVLLSARGVVPVFAGDGHTCSASTSQQAYLRHQRRVVSPAEWYQDRLDVSRVSWIVFTSVFFSCFQGRHIPPERRV